MQNDSLAFLLDRVEEQSRARANRLHEAGVEQVSAYGLTWEETAIVDLCSYVRSLRRIGKDSHTSAVFLLETLLKVKEYIAGTTAPSWGAVLNNISRAIESNNGIYNVAKRQGETVALTAPAFDGWLSLDVDSPLMLPVTTGAEQVVEAEQVESVEQPQPLPRWLIWSLLGSLLLNVGFMGLVLGYALKIWEVIK